MPRGSLASKPTWSNTSGCSVTSAFFVFLAKRKVPQCQQFVSDVIRTNELQTWFLVEHIQ